MVDLALDLVLVSISLDGFLHLTVNSRWAAEQWCWKGCCSGEFSMGKNIIAITALKGKLSRQ